MRPPPLADIGSNAARHRFFKGCTRPAMFMGVPLVPFLLVSGAALLAAVWSFYLVSAYLALLIAIACAPIVLAMRLVTKRDDQRLRQLLLRARLRTRHANRGRWGAVSYAPLRFKKRTHLRRP